MQAAFFVNKFLVSYKLYVAIQFSFNYVNTISLSYKVKAKRWLAITNTSFRYKVKFKAKILLFTQTTAKFQLNRILQLQVSYNLH